MPETLDLQRDTEGRGYRLCDSEAKAASGSASRATTVEIEREREEVRMAELLRRFEEQPALPLLAYRVNDLKGLEQLPKERHSNIWQVDRREGEQLMHDAKRVADEDDVEKLDTLPGFSVLSAAALLAQEEQTSQHHHKRHSKKSWRRR